MDVQEKKTASVSRPEKRKGKRGAPRKRKSSNTCKGEGRAVLPAEEMGKRKKEKHPTFLYGEAGHLRRARKGGKGGYRFSWRIGKKKKGSVVRSTGEKK